MSRNNLSKQIQVRAEHELQRLGILLNKFDSQELENLFLVLPTPSRRVLRKIMGYDKTPPADTLGRLAQFLGTKPYKAFRGLKDLVEIIAHIELGKTIYWEEDEMSESEWVRLFHNYAAYCKLEPTTSITALYQSHCRLRKEHGLTPLSPEVLGLNELQRKRRRNVKGS